MNEIQKAHFIKIEGLQKTLKNARSAARKAQLEQELATEILAYSESIKSAQTAPQETQEAPQEPIQQEVKSPEAKKAEKLEKCKTALSNFYQERDAARTEYYTAKNELRETRTDKNTYYEQLNTMKQDHYARMDEIFAKIKNCKDRIDQLEQELQSA
jgi:chromosome segregation ATPase